MASECTIMMLARFYMNIYDCIWAILFLWTHLVGAAEQGLARVHLHKDASKGPHVYGQIVGHPQQNLRGAVETTLDVLVNLQQTHMLYTNAQFSMLHLTKALN